MRETQPDVGREKLLLSELTEEIIAFMRFDKDFRRYAVVECDFKASGLIEGNHDHLKQVLINPLRNAAQSIAISGRDSGPDLHFHPRGLDWNRSEVVLYIHDSGGGIDSEVLPRIFECGFSTKQRATEYSG